MRKEEQERRVLAKRLQGFYGVYCQKANKWAAEFMANDNNIEEDDPHGWNVPDIDGIILRMIPEEFQDITEQLKYSWLRCKAVSVFSEECIRPFNGKLENTIKAWWKATWKKNYIDFSSIPSAPPFSFEKIDTWNYRMGTLHVKVCGKARTKTIKVMAGNTIVWEFALYCPHTSDVPELILPRMKRIASICDWNTMEEWSVATRNAVLKSLWVIKSYYTEDSDYRFLLQKFSWYYIKDGKDVPEKDATYAYS